MEKSKLFAACAKKVFFENRAFCFSKEVYEPDEDTFLLARNLRVQNGEKVLEIGSGCGIVSILLALRLARVVALDISPRATECCRLNAEANEASEELDIIRGDLFGPLRPTEYFDQILFNAPYLPTENHERKDWIDYAWSGGRRGRQVIDRFLQLVSNYLKPEGRILLVQSTLSDVQNSIRRLEEMGFSVKVLEKRKSDFETIVLIEATKLSS